MKSHKLKAIGRKIKKRRRRRENLHDQRKPIKLKFINKLNRTHYKYNREGKKIYIYIYIYSIGTTNLKKIYPKLNRNQSYTPNANPSNSLYKKSQSSKTD